MTKDITDITEFLNTEFIITKGQIDDLNHFTSTIKQVVEYLEKNKDDLTVDGFKNQIYCVKKQVWAIQNRLTHIQNKQEK